MKNILITGGAGYIGSKISHDLIDRKYNVIIIDNLSTGHKKLIPNKSLFYQADFSNAEILKKIFKKFKIDTIIHLAASLSVEESMKNPEKYYLNNVFKTQKMLELISIYKIKKFIFSSTCAVYGENRSHKIDESGLIKPKSHYGLTKFLCESVIKNFSKNSSFKYYILRYFNVIGADYKLRCGAINNSGQLFKVIAKNIIKKNFKINVFGNNYLTKDGTCIRDYIDVNDLSNIHMSIIDKKKLNSLTLNCGIGKGYSVLEIVKNFEHQILKKIKIQYKKRRKGDVEKIYCNTNLLNKLKLLRKKTKLSDSVKTQLLWEKTLY